MHPVLYTFSACNMLTSQSNWEIIEGSFQVIYAQQTVAHSPPGLAQHEVLAIYPLAMERAKALSHEGDTVMTPNFT